MGKWGTAKITDVKDVKYRRYLQEVPGRLSSLSNSVNAKFIGKLFGGPPIISNFSGVFGGVLAVFLAAADYFHIQRPFGWPFGRPFLRVFSPIIFQSFISA